MDLSPLVKLGLTENEAKTYIALNKLGQTTVGPIVSAAGVTRSKIYDILDRLHQKGLVSKIVRSGTKHFSATEPQAIVNYVKQKEQELRKEKTLAENLVSILQAQQKLKETTAEIFVGSKGLERALTVLIEQAASDDVYYAFGASTGEQPQLSKLIFSRIQLKREEKNLHTKIIFTEDAKGKFSTQENSSLVEVRYLQQDTPAAINVCGIHTVIAILTTHPVAILIRSEEVTQSFQQHFTILWQMARK